MIDLPPQREGGRIDMIGGLVPIPNKSKRQRKSELRRWESVNTVIPLAEPTIAKGVTISFSDADREGVVYPKNDALVITTRILGAEVARVLIDNGAYCNLIFKSALDQLGNLASYIKPYNGVLKGFGDMEVVPYGVIKLTVELIDNKDSEIRITRTIDFVIINQDSIYNAFLGRPFLDAFEAVASSHYYCIKFPTPSGSIGTVRGDQVMAKRCFYYPEQFFNLAKVSTDKQKLLESRPPGDNTTPETRIKPIIGNASSGEETERSKTSPIRDAVCNPVVTKEILNIDHPSADLGRIDTAGEEYLRVDMEPRLGFEPENILDPRGPSTTGAVEEMSSIKVDPERPDLEVLIGSQIPDSIRNELIEFLQNNVETFAWSHQDMVGISPKHACHHLKIDPKRRPIAQKRRKFGPEKYEALANEVKKLVDNKLVEEAQGEPQWVANAVLVKKTNNTWRLCIDFTDLNDACPKDHFPMPHIDHLVDSTAGHEMMSFMDAFAGYHQIPMAVEDVKHTSFYTEKNIYNWVRMPFGLKNAGATYQRLVNEMFADQIGKTMEVYIDDIVVKSAKKEDHLRDLKETFRILKEYNMKLNPKKCHFGVTAGKFLGHIVSQRGIEANPEKIKAIMDMREPRNLKEVQRLTGCLAALSRFISRLGDRSKPFFTAIKNQKFAWGKESQAAFAQLKEHLANPQILAKPTSGEKLFLYLAASETAISAVLTRAEGQLHLPVYFVSQTLHDAETRYTPLEKLAYALVMSIRKLRAYFFEHSVEVLTTMPLRQVLHRPDTNGRLLKWSLEIGQYDISYAPRTAIKGQALADFLVELTFPKKKPDVKHPPWKLYVDGSSTATSAGAGVVLIGPEGQSFAHAIKFEFPATNNEAEYEALIAGLDLASAIGVECLHIFMDSLLVVSQVKGEYETRNDRMTRYYEHVVGLCEKFPEVFIEQVPREHNSQADALSKLASSEGTADLTNVILTEQRKSTIDLERVIAVVAPGESWMTSIISYLRSGELPPDKIQARQLRIRAARYLMLDDVLYRRSYYLPLLKCITPLEGRRVFSEIHDGVCGNHAGGQSLAHKTIRQGYYWPTLRKDAAEYAKTCHRCQVTAPIIRSAPEYLNSIYSPWPFALWGIDLIGPLPTGPGGVKYAVVAVDYFTKWVEAEPLNKIDQPQIIRFIWKNIICRFGIPYAIISDNGKQFDGLQIMEFFDKWKIKKVFSTPYHPQTNGQVEAINKILKHTIKAKIEERQGKWASELPDILWAYRTTTRNATGESPFALAFGSEAVIPSEVAILSHRTSQDITEENEKALRLELDLLEEKRLKSAHRNATSKQRAERFFNSKVKIRKFQKGDLVLKRILGTNTGTLGPNWEGPLRVESCLKNGAYKLEQLDGTPDQYLWNSLHLKKYHQ